MSSESEESRLHSPPRANNNNPVNPAQIERWNRGAVCLTGEQRKIVNYNLSSLLQTNGILRIMAYAGTGKITMLVEMCKRNPHLKFLLVVFNKSVHGKKNKRKFL